MAKELRTTLLSQILSMEGVFHHKYSTAYNILTSVIELEKNEREKNKLPKEIFERYEKIKSRAFNLDEKIKGFPLLVVEQYFLRNSKQLDAYVYMVYGDLEYTDFQSINLYELLENFFREIYFLCVEIADYYSLEIKLKSKKQINSSEGEDNYL